MNTLEKIVTNRHLPILFVGSGLSKRYLYKYPTWDELLKHSFSKFNNDLFQYHKLVDMYTRQGYSNFEIYTKLGTYIEDEFNKAFFDRKIKIGNSDNPSWVTRGISPYKMFLSRYFKRLRLNRNTQDELNKLKLLKNKISAVITTNYDKLIEEEIFSSDYSVFIHQNELFSNESYNIAEIYKIHGCVSDASSIIITENDYRNFKESRKLIIAKMLTLFAESPIIFMGYSLTDEDIRDIIVDFLSCLTPKELNGIEEHFVFISWKENEQDLVEIKRTITTKNGVEIPITEIQTDNFTKVYDTLNQIVPGVSPLKIRETKRVIKKIVDENISSENAESIIVGLDDLQNVDLSSKPLAIAIGYRESILNKYGYGMLSDELIFEDILYDNKKFDADNMCFERYKSISATRLLPVFKYAKLTTIPISKESKLYAYMNSHHSWEQLVPRNILKSIASVPEFDDEQSIQNEIANTEGINKQAGILLKNIKQISLANAREICKQLFISDKVAAIKSTHFKRCVMYIDLMENGSI